MSERPFMQLYVSDFIGDTLALSTEQVGAYLLLLMAMWNAGGLLPDDDAKLARICRVSVKKWRAMADDLMGYFEREEGVISHNRLTKELQKSERKSELRASAGAKGGAAKALKNNNPTVANAKQKPKHLPDTITREEKGKITSSPKRAVRLSEDWTLDPEWRLDALEAGLPQNLIDTEAAKMRDWSLSSPNGAKRDWRATWRNWCRSAVERLKAQPRGSPQKPMTASQLADQISRDDHDRSGLENQKPDYLQLAGPFRAVG